MHQLCAVSCIRNIMQAWSNPKSQPPQLKDSAKLYKAESTDSKIRKIHF